MFCVALRDIFTLTKIVWQVEKNGFRRMRILGGYDPCFSTHAEDYFNRVDVQTSLHASISGKNKGKWNVCK